MRKSSRNMNMPKITLLAHNYQNVNRIWTLYFSVLQVKQACKQKKKFSNYSKTTHFSTGNAKIPSFVSCLCLKPGIQLFRGGIQKISEFKILFKVYDLNLKILEVKSGH